MIHGINLFYVRVNSNFHFFMNVKSCFKFPVMHEKGQIILRDSVITKGIGDPFCSLLLTKQILSVCDNIPCLNN